MRLTGPWVAKQKRRVVPKLWSPDVGSSCLELSGLCTWGCCSDVALPLLHSWCLNTALEPPMCPSGRFLQSQPRTMVVQATEHAPELLESF